MDEDSQDEILIGSLSRHRSPIFSKEEVRCIISLVEKYKSIILNKSINHAACHAKEVAWTKLTKAYNSQGFKYNRSTENLKSKWDNMKKEVRKLSKNLLDIDQDFDEISSQIVKLLIEAENMSESTDFSEELKVLGKEESKIDQDEPKLDSELYWDDTDKELNTSKEHDDGDKKRLSSSNRSMNFTPQECSILLNCVRQEKKYILSKLQTGKANRLKNQAWIRVTDSFNKLSPHKRSTKMLQTKFTNMKKLVGNKSRLLFKNIYKRKYTKLKDENDRNKKIKTEPMSSSDDEIEQNVCDDSELLGMTAENGRDSASNSIHEAPDPLSTVLNGDSGFGFMAMDLPSAKYTANKEILKLQSELLQCQLETAKLERERIEQCMRAEAMRNDSRAIEMALRLRAARLEAVTAAMKVPLGHPALEYTTEEARAQQYLSQYHQT